MYLIFLLINYIMLVYSYYIGIAVIFLTHIWIIVKGGMPMNNSVPHSIINLIAGFMIAIWFMNLSSSCRN